MKLHEIKRVRRAAHETTVEVEPAGGEYGLFDVNVEYDFEPESYTQHVPGDPTTRERHGAELNIESITLADDVQETDEDGESTGKVFPKGMDATKLPGWSKADDEYVYDQVYREIESHDPSDDFDEPDDDYDDYR